MTKKTEKAEKQEKQEKHCTEKKPVKLHLLDGSYRKERHQAVIEPDATRKKPKAPKHISGYENAAKVDREAMFEAWADYLYEEGSTREVDGFLIGQLVEAYIQYLHAVNLARTDPEAMVGRTLISTVVLRYAREIREIIKEFNMTPALRYRQRKEQEVHKQGEDPVAEFLEIASKQ